MVQQTETRPGILVSLDGKSVLRVLAIGAVAGLIAWGVALLLDATLFKNALCGGSTTMKCETSLVYASASSSIIAAAVAMIGLIRFQIYRSLLVVIAATIGLWGIVPLLDDVSWVLAGLVSVFLYAVSYLLFTWTAQVRLFLIALLLIGIEVVVIRLTLGA